MCLHWDVTSWPKRLRFWLSRPSHICSIQIQRLRTYTYRGKVLSRMVGRLRKFQFQFRPSVSSLVAAVVQARLGLQALAFTRLWTARASQNWSLSRPQGLLRREGQCCSYTRIGTTLCIKFAVKVRNVSSYLMYTQSLDLLLTFLLCFRGSSGR